MNRKKLPVARPVHVFRKPFIGAVRVGRKNSAAGGPSAGQRYLSFLSISNKSFTDSMVELTIGRLWR
jgi:hypothetical protein